MSEERIPPGFGRDSAGRLLIAGKPADAWAADAGDTPLFLYDRALIAGRIARFRRAFPGVRLHYAVKANPMPALLASMAPLVDGFDVASAGELDRALVAGMAAAHISFAGPAKRDRELAAAITAGATLNIESAGELDRAVAIGTAKGRPVRAALRVNPPFELKGSGMRMGGGARPFGVDSADAPALLARMAVPAVDFRGFHFFAGSQNLDAAAIVESQRLGLALAAELTADAPVPPPLLNLGGGFGVPYFPADRPLAIEPIGTALAEALAAGPAILGGAEVALELGRWLVAEAGLYLARVIDRKVSAGETFLLTDGGLHHVLAATGNLGTVVRRNYPLVNASRSGPMETAHVVGCLCTPLDRLGDRAILAETQVGDLIALFMAGAYGRTASPEAFLGHPPAREMLVGDSG